MERSSVLAVCICLIYICLLTTAAAETAETSPVEIESIKTEKTENEKNEITWTYTFRFKKAKTGQKITINLALPNSKDLKTSATPKNVKAEGTSNQKWVLEVTKNEVPKEIVITVTGSKDQFKDSSINVHVEVTNSDGKLVVKESETKPGPAVSNTGSKDQFKDSSINVHVKVTNSDGKLVVKESEAKSEAAVSNTGSKDRFKDSSINVHVKVTNSDGKLVVKESEAKSEAAVSNTGSKDRFKDSSINVHVEVTNSNRTLVAEESETKPEAAVSSSISLMTGVGIGWGVDDWIDFKFTEKAVFIENDSRARPFILTGVLIPVKSLSNKCSLGGWVDDFLISLVLTDKTPQTRIDGFSFGLSKRISSHLNFVVGYTRAKGQELSPGFQKSASQLIKKINLAEHPEYGRFRGFKPNGNGENQKLLDGLPLVDPTDKDKARFFPGDPVISSYNSTFYVGLVTSLNLLGLFKKQ